MVSYTVQGKRGYLITSRMEEAEHHDEEANLFRRLSEQFSTMLTQPDTGVPEELGDLEALQGVGKFAVRVKCATLAWHTLSEGLDQHEKGDGSVRVEEM